MNAPEVAVFASKRGMFARCRCGWRTEGYDQHGVSLALEKAIDSHESETGHLWPTYGMGKR